MKPLPFTFHHMPPPPHLQQYVQAFWHVEGTGALTLGTIADGCPGLVFHQTEHGLRWGEQKKKLSSFFLYGQTTRLSKMQTGGPFRMTGVIFYPHVMKILFGFNASEVTDDCIDLLLLSGDEGKDLVHKMEDSFDRTTLYSHINNYLSNIVCKKQITQDTIIQNAVIQLMQSNGAISLKQLQQSLFITERTFERRFEQYVGIPAKLFARVCRFQASLQQLRNGEYEKLSDIAFNNGYSDQSHFIRAFKQFSGYSPVEFTNEKKAEEVSLLLIR